MKKLLLTLLIGSSMSLAAQESKPLVRGAYRSYHEFLLNTPGITDSMIIDRKERKHETWKGTYASTPRYASNNKKIKKIWGFCDGDTAYILHQEEFFPVIIENDQYAFVGYNLIDNSGSMAAGVMGGAVGGGIYAANALAKAKSKKTRYILHKSTGTVLHPSRPMLKKEAMRKSKLILYRRYRGELEVPFKFTVNDSMEYSFIRDSFVKLYFDAEVSSVKVCYGDELNKCDDIELTLKGNKYLQCSIPKKEKQPVLIEVRESKGEFDSQSAEKYQNLRE